MRKEKINKLIESWKDDKEVLDIIQADVLALGEYTQAVYYMEFSVAIIKAKYEGKRSEMLWERMIRADMMLMNVRLWE